MKKIIFIMVIIGLAAGGGWWWWQSNKDEEITYQTAPVTRGDLVQSVTATGTINPVLNVQVGSQISGNIQKLMVDYNSVVKAGQVVAQIDPAIYQAVVKQTEGDLANAKAALELAQINATRTEELRKQNVSPQATLDASIAALHQAEAQVMTKEGALAKATTDLKRCTIYSPIDGIVISRLVDVGQTVAASLSAPVIFQIANDLAKMQINTNVAEADIGNIAVDQDVDFTVDAYPYRTFHGKVMQIRNAPITVQNVVTYDTVIAVNNDDLKLKPGMTANVSIVIARREGVLKVSNASFRFRPQDDSSSKNTSAASAPAAGRSKRGERKSQKEDESAPIERTVYLLRGEGAGARPEPVKIKSGISDGIFSEIIEGLKESDPVVIGMTGGQTSSATPPPSSPFSRRF